MALMEQINFIKQKYQDKRPLGVCFNTKDKYYVFDSGTNKVIECSEVECHVIDQMFRREYDRIIELADKYGEDSLDEACYRQVLLAKFR